MRQRVSPARGRIRIIAGNLRGSRLDVPDLPGLRPTSDRVRETLFNWLAPHIYGARCLDLFAGSGALGFEAASRGAAKVKMIERDPQAAALLRANAARLRVSAVEVDQGEALAWLGQAATPRFDIAFVDPPFVADLHQASCHALLPWLAPQALIYVESPRERIPDVPAGWVLWREGATREVRYALYRHRAQSRAEPCYTGIDPSRRLPADS